MSAQYITKKHKDKEGKIIETQYRIDAGFIPTGIQQITQEFMENYCTANGELNWLNKTTHITQFEVERKDKDTGKKYKEIVTVKEYPFVNLRRDFAVKFFPQILKGINTPKKETFAERIARLCSETK